VAAITLEPFPFGRSFAVCLLDDTDLAVLDEIRPVYDRLDHYGIRATKTVWPLRAEPSPGARNVDLVAHTLADAEYRRYCQTLQRRGCELAMHTASGGSNTRERTILGYRVFEDAFGQPPATNIMHGRNRENVYWGEACAPMPGLGRLVRIFEPTRFEGHLPDSPYFWGDICREKTRYVRVFETLAADTLAFDPATPYHEPRKPWVNYWFAASYGAGVRLFQLLRPEAIDAMRRRRGASIIHLYCRHYGVPGSSGAEGVHPRFERLLRYLAAQPDGWYVPVVELLDRLRAVRAIHAEIRGGTLTLTNRTPLVVSDLAIRVPAGVDVADAEGRPLVPRQNRLGQIPVGTLRDRIVLRCTGLGETPRITPRHPVRRPDYPRLVGGMIERIGWQFAHGRPIRHRTGPPRLPWVDALQRQGSRARSIRGGGVHGGGDRSASPEGPPPSGDPSIETP